MKDLETTINTVPCDVVVIGTPIDLNRIVKIKKPTVRVTYELQEIGSPTSPTSSASAASSDTVPPRDGAGRRPVTRPVAPIADHP